MARLNNIISALQTAVEGATDDRGNPVFKNVYRRATNTFDGYPSVTVLHDPGDSEFATAKRGKRTYAFNLTIYDLGADKELTDDEWDKIRDLQDAVTDVIDQLPGIDGLKYPAVPGDIVPIVTGASSALIGVVTVEVSQLVDLA